MEFSWGLIYLLDTILKGFQYGWIILISLLIIIIFLSIKRKSIKHYKQIIAILILVSVFIIFTSRLWGPKFYTNIINTQINNKESMIEEKLEKKYNKNFTFLSKGKTKITDPYAGSTLGQDITYDYSVTYKFKDDDGVIAIVEYKKDSGWDYYQVKRAEYDIEQAIYSYAKKIGIQDEFYVKELNRFESINDSKLDLPPIDDFINREMGISDSLLFVMPKEIKNSKSFIFKALETILTGKQRLTVCEYVVAEDEYKKITNYYESDKVKNNIVEDLDYDMDKKNIIKYQYYDYSAYKQKSNKTTNF